MIYGRKVSDHRTFSVVLILFYITVTDFWGLIDFNRLLPSGGELYDFVWVLLMLSYIVISMKRGRIKKIRTRGTFYPFVILIIYAFLDGITLVSGGQSLFNTLMVLREILYILFFLPMVELKYDIHKVIKQLIILDIIGCFIYMVEMFTGPLTPYHTQGIWERAYGIYRGWSVGPTFTLWLVPLMVFFIADRKYFFSRNKDIVVILLFILTYILKLSRGAMVGLLICFAFAFIKCKGEQLSKKASRILKFAIIGLMAVAVLTLLFPKYIDRAIEGIISVSNSDGTFSVRTNTLAYRISYLQQTGKLLFGLGPLHNEKSNVTLALAIDKANRGVIAADIAYGTIVIRYGIIGILLFVFPMINNFYKLHKSKNKIAMSYAIYGVALLFVAVTSHNALCFQAFLSMGFIYGITLKSMKPDQTNRYTLGGVL